MSNKFYDPVNYRLTGEEMQNYNSFLDLLTDVPESLPLKNINISKAGISNQELIFNIQGIDGKFVQMYCEISLYVSLEGNRGIHMSRCEEILFESLDKNFNSLDEAALYLAKQLKDKQNSNNAYVNLKAHYFHPHLTKKSRKTSYDKIYITSEIKLNGDQLNIISGIEAYNITACPCTRTYTKFSVVPELQNMGINIEDINKILNLTLSGTHTQRGTTILKVENNHQEISINDLYNILDNSVHLIYDLLKRPDEHELVVRALKNPQFTEDVIRDVANNLIIHLNNKLQDDSYVYIESLLNDSIHIHNVHTKLETSFIEIKKKLN